MPRRYWLQTLGCPKNEVDSEKLRGRLEADGLRPASSPRAADVVVVNTCAFVEAAREESIETILALAAERRAGAELVVTGCLAERYGAEVAAAIPEVTRVAPFGVELVGPSGERGEPVRFRRTPSFDLLRLPRPRTARPWAYVKVAEGCDRHCGFCAIPSFRGAQRSRPPAEVLAEIDGLAVSEVVLVAQDLLSYGLDRNGPRSARPARPPIVELIDEVAARVEWVRLLYLYPSGLSSGVLEAIARTGVPYFDLSLQHASGRLLRTMRRPGSAERWLRLVGRIRELAPEATLRSSFVVGYPGETEQDHDELLAFLEAARLDWAGFFLFSREPGTYADRLPGQVPAELAAERLREAAALQDGITEAHRLELVGRRIEVVVDRPGVGRSVREAPEIDGIVRLPPGLPVGHRLSVQVVAAEGVDLVAEAAEAAA